MTATAATTPRAATPVTLTPLEIAWAEFCRRVHVNQPRALRALNSPAALSGRATDIDALMLAAKDMLVALVEDTAQHVALADSAELVSAVEDHMDDMASDVRGALIDAIHRNAA